MLKPLASLVLLVLCLSPVLDAQMGTPPKPETKTTKYLDEAFVVEQFSRKLKFENDGTFLREDSSRIRIQSEAGVQRYGLLSFSYPSATGTFEIGYVRVVKPNGTVVETPAENIQDMAAQITREAPSYSDLHEKHIAVKGLSVGDIVEYKIVEHVTKPLAPGQFWAEYSFTDAFTVLDEELEVSVPSDRAIKLKSSFNPTINDAQGYRVYTWHHSTLQPKDKTNEKRENTKLLWEQARGRFPSPDVVLSSFGSWEEVGRWYQGLQQERVKPTADVTAKALELTKNASTDDAKLHALYNYVSSQFHYIGISFGIGRYQPHSAGEVLANQYGDCKDKHTLLASLLTAAGIPSYPALISTTRDVESEVPSPGQFDHVITIVPRGGDFVWLDTTTEVGPYQYLISPLRDKHALAVWTTRPPGLVSTPPDLPYPSTESFNMDAKLSEAGTLEGQTDFSMRGDLEYVLRNGFRSVALPQWKDLVQQISLGSGFGGEVSEVQASSPEKTEEPFHFSYKYTRKEFGDWPNHRIMAPTPFISLPASGDEELLPFGPLWLGPNIDIEFKSQVELPTTYRPELPAALHLRQDFAQYDVTYQFKDGKILTDRHLKTFMKEVPDSERKAYKDFVKALADDYSKFIPLSSNSGMAKVNIPGAASIAALRNLPDSLNPNAAQLEKEARDQRAVRDVQDAVSSLYRAVSADPKFARAWVILGSMLFAQHQIEAGKEAFRNAISADPQEPAIQKAYGWGLMGDYLFEDAIPVWQEFRKSYPDDDDGLANLGQCYLRLKRYSEAAKAFEEGAKDHPDRADIQAGVGSAYLLAGDREKAAAAFHRLAELKADSNVLNDTAYQMAEADFQLPLALAYAKKASLAAEEESSKITLSSLKIDDVRDIQKLAAYWDTLGWIDGRLSDLENAQLYLTAAWKLTQDATVAEHLCHVYERLHKKESAIQMCRLAVYRLSLSERITSGEFKEQSEQAQKQLDHLTATSKPQSMVETSELVSRERNFKMPRFLPGNESAEFFVLLASDGKSPKFKVEDVKFISGSEKMKAHGVQLKSVSFDFPAPNGAVAHIVRRGILGCYQYSGCSFVLLDPASVTSLD